jgi:S1-C subfamily serine protease
MSRRRWLWWVFISIAIIGVSAGAFFYYRQSLITVPDKIRSNTSVIDLGVVYLPVTSNTACCYNLKVDSGALVTQVGNGSPVDLAGIKEGDVILSFNGVAVRESSPLLGMIRSCPVDNDITLGVSSNGITRQVTLLHP